MDPPSPALVVPHPLSRECSIGYFDQDADIDIVSRGRSVELAIVAAASAMFELSCGTRQV